MRRASLWFLLVLSAGCGSRQWRPVPAAVLLDPQVAIVDAEAPWLDLTTGDGSVFLESGWAPMEDLAGTGDWNRFAWIIDGEGRFVVDRPAAPELDFVARCHPFLWAGGPVQRIHIRVGDRELTSAPLEPGWNDVRIPLPAGSLEPGLNRIRLVFDHATSPTEVGAGDDGRRLCAAFNRIAIVPREVKDVTGGVIGSRLDPSRKVARLPSFGSWVFPLPPSSEVQVAVDRIPQVCPGCEVSVERLGPLGSLTPVFRGAPGGARGRVRFRTPAAESSRVRVRFVGPGGGPLPLAVWEIPLDDGFLSFRRLGGQRAKPDLFVYLVDTLRWDSTEPSAERPPPRIGAFARDSVTYASAWSNSSWTLPSTVSLLTGTFPDRHGIMAGDVAFLGKSEVALPARLAVSGYESVGISQSIVSSPQFGIDRGFDAFFLSDSLNGPVLTSATARRAFTSWFVTRRDQRRPLFAFVHTVDPHAPYTPPPGYTEQADRHPGTLPPAAYVPAALAVTPHTEEDLRRLRGLYEGEVAFADEQFGRFLDLLRVLDVYDGAGIALVADHGEEFGEHGGFEHGRTLYEEVVHVPLVVKYPDERGAGSRVTERVGLADVAPTFAWLGSVVAPGLDGRPLPGAPFRVRRGHVVPTEIDLPPNERSGAVSYRAVVFGDLKVIESRTGVDQFGKPAPRFQVFDLAADPGEQAPVPPDDPRFRRAQAEAKRFFAERDALWKGRKPPPTGINRESIEKLRALGYIR